MYKNRDHSSGWGSWMEASFWGFRTLLAVLCITILTWVLHFREVRVEVLEIGTVAPRYVIAQIDFTFADREATAMFRGEAARDIGKIYRVDEEDLLLFRQNLEQLLTKNSQWREELSSTFQDLYSLIDETEKALTTALFTGAATLHRIEALHQTGPELFLLPHHSFSHHSIPDSFWDSFIDKLVKEKIFPVESIHYVVNSFTEHSWIFIEDLSTERYFRDLVQKTVIERYTHIDAGSKLIKQGEIVTARHIAMTQAMQQAMTEALHVWSPRTLTGSVLLATSLLSIAVAVLRFLHREVFNSGKKLCLVAAIVLLTLGLSKGVDYLLLYEGTNWIGMVRFPLLVPLATLFTCLLLGKEVSLLVSLFLLTILGVTLVVDHSFFFLLNLTASLAAIFFSPSLHRRRKTFITCCKIWLVCLPLIIGFNLIGNTFWTISLPVDICSSFLFLQATAILLICLLPIFEFSFNVTTAMTLMEYMDLNHPLLKRLALEAPGTYQHSLVVGNLSEAAARAIGANDVLCRVSSLYHDIGKLSDPHYFTENQLGGFNIHQLLTPLESTQVIIAHVPEGEALARKYRLPESFCDIIREHHGTTLVYYFYRKQLETVGGDLSKINSKIFRYPGPKPHSKESGIIMLADSIEATSHSIDKISEEEIVQVLDRLVEEKVQDGQFDESQLTFEELSIVKKTIIKALLVSRHLRIKYPEPLAPNHSIS